jgi:hypothetical protein
VLCIEQFVPEQRSRKPLQVVHSRVSAAGRRAAHGQGLVIALVRSVRSGIVAAREILNFLRLPETGRVLHARGLKDLLADIAVVAHAADFLNDAAEQDIAIIAVSPAGARREGRGARSVERHVVFQVAQLCNVAVEFGAEDVACASGVGQQVMDGDFLRHITVRIVFEVPADGIVKAEFARLGELGDGNGREHLVHRAEVEFRVRAVGNFLLAIRHAPGAADHLPAVPRHADRAGETVFCGQPVQVLADCGCEPGGAQPFGGRSGRLVGTEADHRDAVRRRGIQLEFDDECSAGTVHAELGGGALVRRLQHLEQSESARLAAQFQFPLDAVLQRHVAFADPLLVKLARPGGVAAVEHLQPRPEGTLAGCRSRLAPGGREGGERKDESGRKSESHMHKKTQRGAEGSPPPQNQGSGNLQLYVIIGWTRRMAG